MEKSKSIADVFLKLSEYEFNKLKRVYPGRCFLRYSKCIRFMDHYEYVGSRVKVHTKYGDTLLGDSSSKIFDEVLNTGISTRLIEYEKEYGSLDSDKDSLDKRISYESAKRLVNYIRSSIMKLNEDKNIEFTDYVAGSFRREKPTIGDLDFIVTNFDESNRDAIIDMYGSLFEKRLVSGSKKIAGIIKGVQVDIRFIESKQLPCMLLHSTGSKEHNIFLRKRAISMGYRLNEYCLTDNEGNEIYPQSEEDVFKILGLEYVKPSDR